MVAVVRKLCIPGMLLVAVVSHGCDDLSGFRGDYEGHIVSGDFVRSCFGSDTTATLHFSPDFAVASMLDASASQRNRLTTNDGTFDDTVLEPVDALRHDPLSQLDFPGPSRLRNYLLFARPESGPLAGRDATVVVSLMDQGRIEVRVIARTEDGTSCEPAAGEDAGAADAGSGAETGGGHYFGLFRLKSSSS